MSTLDREYLARRREDSLARAKAAADPAIARIHRDFARHYEQKLGAEQPMTLRVGDQG